jgi:hypothetical protein
MNKLCSVFLLFLLSSCEKNIDFTLDASQPTLVVEAQIENEMAPTVVLTKSVDYFSQINSQIFESSFVHNADVYISNGILTHKLKEYAIPFFPGVNTYYYGIDSAQLSTAFLGALNTSYTLRVVAEGKEYLSTTKIPGLDWIPDSVYYKRPNTDIDTMRRNMFVTATDPSGLGNFIRYFTKKNSGPYLPGRNSVFSDEIIEGTTYTTQVDPGMDRNNPDQKFSFEVGDTVTLKFCNIDKATYTFWNTWEFSLQSIGNPFAQPNKVIGNISNGALGAFCGYASWFKTTILQ